MLFYDVEAFPYYWCVVVIDDETETRHVFEDVSSLRDFYKEYYKTHTWVGYNSRQYDAPMVRFIMLGLDPYQCSQDLIVLGKKWFQFGFQITQQYKRIPLKNFDCVILNKGLKKLEGFRGSSIIESDIDWNTDRPLTREEKDKTIAYCTHDVKETRKIFYDTIEEYHAHESLIAAFELAPEHFNKTKAQLGALILGAQNQNWFDEWEFELPDTLLIERYTEVVDWFKNKENHDYKNKLETEIAGVPHTFAWGGIHGAIPKYGGEGYYVNMDVASYYPALLIEYGFLSRTVKDPLKFTQIRDDRIVLKRNKDPRQQPYKIVINGTSGAMKDKFNALYDPRQNNSMCVSGQLLLLDLIEKLEDHCEIIQSNTDGVLVKLRDENDYDKIEAIGKKWSARTRMELEYDKFKKVFQKDVNNYIIVPDTEELWYESGMPKWKCKGAWAKEWYKEVKRDGKKVLVQDYTEYDLVILKEALHNFFVLDIPVEKTINECMDLIKFQKIVMVSRKYDCGIHGRPTLIKYKDEKGKRKERLELTEDCKLLNERHLRVFASTNEEHGGIFKRHAIRKNLNKVSDTPIHAFIENGNIEGASTSDYPLDKEYYIKIAKDRIKKFVNVKEV